MTQNFVMARTQANFRLDDWLKDQLDDYCELYGLKKERFVEALVFGAVVKGSFGISEVFTLIQELAQRSGSAGEPAAPASLTEGTRLVVQKRQGRGRSRHKGTEPGTGQNQAG